jgi:hypothetical protein
MQQYIVRATIIIDKYKKKKTTRFLLIFDLYRVV